jgi:TPR repeat protein
MADAATLYEGVGGEKNLREALTWFHMAADHEQEPSAEAQYSLACIYEQVRARALRIRVACARA